MACLDDIPTSWFTLALSAVIVQFAPTTACTFRTALDPSWLFDQPSPSGHHLERWLIVAAFACVFDGQRCRRGEYTTKHCLGHARLSPPHCITRRLCCQIALSFRYLHPAGSLLGILFRSGS